MRSLLLTLVLAGCGNTGQTMVSYPAHAQGAPVSFTSGAWTVTLDAARAALGPIYFCATQTASESLCPVAINELPRTVDVDALSPADQPLGDVRGTTGTIHSATLDWGITWFATQPDARAASALGHSAHFEGHAERAGVTRRFVADVDLTPQFQGTLAVNGIRLPAPHEVIDPPGRLRVRFDTGAWLSSVDYDELDKLTGDPAVFTPATRAGGSLALVLSQIAPTFEWISP